MLHLIDLNNKLRQLRETCYTSPFNYQHPRTEQIVPAAAEPKRPTTSLDMAIFQRNNIKKLIDDKTIVRGQRIDTSQEAERMVKSISNITSPPIPWHMLTNERKRELICKYQPDMPNDLIDRFIQSKKKGIVSYNPFTQNIIRLGTL